MSSMRSNYDVFVPLRLPPSVSRSRPNQIAGPGPKSGPTRKSESEFQDGGGRTRIFTHKIVILA